MHRAHFEETEANARAHRLDHDCIDRTTHSPFPAEHDKAAQHLFCYVPDSRASLKRDKPIVMLFLSDIIHNLEKLHAQLKTIFFCSGMN